ncbi:MAG: type II CAAX endopeptidase family protein [Planctomycetota bacterium]
MNDSPHSPPDESASLEPVTRAYVPMARPLAFVAPPPPPQPGDEMLLASISRRQAVTDLALFAVLIVVFELGVGEIIRRVIGANAVDAATASETAKRVVVKEVFGPMLCLRAAGAIGLVAWIVRRRGGRAPSLGLAGRPWWVEGLWGLLTLRTIYAATAMTFLTLYLAWPEFLKQFEENGARLMQLIPRMHPAKFFLIASVIGVYEEIVFRGFVLPRLRRLMGSWIAAIAVSTAVFTSLHAADQTSAALVMVSLLSMVLSAAAVWRRSIVPAIVAHVLFDWTQYLSLYLQAGEAWR